MSQSDRIISFSAIGLDSPGLVSKITRKIFEMGGNVIDVEENCRRGLFSIFLAIDFSAVPSPIEEITWSLKSIEQESGLKVIVGKWREESTEGVPEKGHHIVTILGKDRPGIIAEVSQLFYGYNINIERCRMIARGALFSMEMVIDTGAVTVGPAEDQDSAISRMKGELKDLCRVLNQSVVIQSEQMFRRTKKMVVFDVESTLIQESSARDFLKEVENRIRRMDPRLRFEGEDTDPMETLIRNAEKLRGIPFRDLETLAQTVQLHQGTLELIKILKSVGFKLALLSSGLDVFLRTILKSVRLDYAFSNALKVDEAGILTGELEEPVLTHETKNEILEFIMNAEDVRRDQVIAIGDGSARSQFIRNVGLSIAYNPVDPAIQTDGILSHEQITSLLYCLGIPKSELEKVSESIASSLR